MKAFSSKAKKLKEEKENSNKEAPKEEEMVLFVRCYNRYLKRNKLKHFDRGLINFKNTHPPKREHKKKMMLLRVMSAENWGIVELLVQLSPNIIKRKIRRSTRRKENAQMIVKPISRGKKRIRDPPQILAQVQMMSVSTYV